MPTEPPNDAVALRKEISTILNNITNRGSLLFCLWFVQNIDQKLPPPDEIKKLHQIFIRVADAFKNKKKVSAADWKMMLKYVGEIGQVGLSRYLASTVKFYRVKAKLSRQQVAKKLGIRVRMVLALERGAIKDMSLPWLYQLADALNVDASEFIDRICELEKAGQ